MRWQAFSEYHSLSHTHTSRVFSHLMPGWINLLARFWEVKPSTWKKKQNYSDMERKCETLHRQWPEFRIKTMTQGLSFQLKCALIFCITTWILICICNQADFVAASPLHQRSYTPTPRHFNSCLISASQAQASPSASEPSKTTTLWVSCKSLDPTRQTTIH